jgi:hypothetical protein
VQVQPLADGQSVEDAFRIPVGSGPVKGFARFDDFMEAATDLLEGSEVFEEVGVYDVHVVHLETL